jgi:hypothetical protein
MKAIVALVTTVYGLSIALSLVVGFTAEPRKLIALGWLSMLLPAVSVLVIYITMNGGPRIRWDHIPYRYVALAIFLTPTVLQAVILPLTIVLQGGVQSQEWLTLRPDGLYHTPAARGWGAVTFQGLLERLLLNAAVGLAIVSFRGGRSRNQVIEPGCFPTARSNGHPARSSCHCDIIWALGHVPFQLSCIQHVDGVSPVKLASMIPFGMFAAV